MHATSSIQSHLGWFEEHIGDMSICACGQTVLFRKCMVHMKDAREAQFVHHPEIRPGFFQFYSVTMIVSRSRETEWRSASERFGYLECRTIAENSCKLEPWKAFYVSSFKVALFEDTGGHEIFQRSLQSWNTDLRRRYKTTPTLLRLHVVQCVGLSQLMVGNQ